MCKECASAEMRELTSLIWIRDENDIADDSPAFLIFGMRNIEGN